MLFFAEIRLNLQSNFHSGQSPKIADEVSGSHSGLFRTLFSLLFGELRADVAGSAGYFYTSEDYQAF